MFISTLVNSLPDRWGQKEPMRRILRGFSVANHSNRRIDILPPGAIRSGCYSNTGSHHQDHKGHETTTDCFILPDQPSNVTFPAVCNNDYVLNKHLSSMCPERSGSN